MSKNAPSDPFDTSSEKSEPFDWRYYLHVIGERWWLVCLFLLLGGILSAFLISREQTLYAARSVMFIEQQTEKVLNGQMQSVRNDEVRSIDMINTVVETFNGYPMAERVAKRLELTTDPAFAAAIKWSKEKDGELTTAVAAAKLLAPSGFVRGAYREMTRLIDIIARTPDPAVSTKLANGYADEYLRMLLEQTSEASKAASQFLVEEAERLGAKLRLSEEALQSFRERERAASLETMLREAQDVVDQSTADIQQVEGFTRQLDADLNSVAGLGGDTEQLMRLASVSTDPRVAALNAQVTTLQRDLDEMARRYREGHPAHTATKNRLEVLRGEMGKVVVEVIGQLEARRSQAEAQLETLRLKRADSEQRLLTITGKSVEYNTLSRNLDADRALYDSVLARLKEVDVTSGLTNQSITVQERARGAGPVPSQTVKFILLGLIGGLAAGIGAILGLNYLDPSLRTIEQVEQRIGLSVVATVPRLKQAPLQGGGGAMLTTMRDRRGLVAEAFRTMRATLAHISGRDKNRIFLITSAIPGEGKTFTSCNFAAILAQQDFRTLLIDADLRKPSVSKMLFSENLKPGLSEVLLRHATLEQAIVPTKIDKLWLLSAGGIAPNPSELLTYERLKELLDELSSNYDRIVIDSSPVLAVRDPLLLAPFADAVCLITRAGHSPSKATAQASRLLTEAGTPPVGIVLNGVRHGRGSYYAYAYRAYGTYGGKGVYGDSPAAADPTI